MKLFTWLKNEEHFFWSSDTGVLDQLALINIDQCIRTPVNTELLACVLLTHGCVADRTAGVWAAAQRTYHTLRKYMRCDIVLLARHTGCCWVFVIIQGLFSPALVVIPQSFDSGWGCRLAGWDPLTCAFLWMHQSRIWLGGPGDEGRITRRCQDNLSQFDARAAVGGVRWEEVSRIDQQPRELEINPLMKVEQKSKMQILLWLKNGRVERDW